MNQAPAANRPATPAQPSPAMAKLDEILGRLVRMEAALEGLQASQRHGQAPRGRAPQRDAQGQGRGGRRDGNASGRPGRGGEGSAITDHFEGEDHFVATLEAAEAAAHSQQEREFTDSLRDRYQLYGKQMFLSERQANWLYKLSTKKAA